MEERRIGTRERELAMGALDEHHREGRLSSSEYTERSATAATARVRSELDALFGDLPQPHPVYPTERAAEAPHDAPSGAAPSGNASSGAAPPGRGEDDLPELVLPAGAALARHVGKLGVFTPVIAFGLFALTGFRFGIIFLLVPVAFAVLGWIGHRYGA